MKQLWSKIEDVLVTIGMIAVPVLLLAACGYLSRIAAGIERLATHTISADFHQCKEVVADVDSPEVFEDDKIYVGNGPMFNGWSEFDTLPEAIAYIRQHPELYKSGILTTSEGDPPELLFENGNEEQPCQKGQVSAEWFDVHGHKKGDVCIANKANAPIESEVWSFQTQSWGYFEPNTDRYCLGNTCWTPSRLEIQNLWKGGSQHHNPKWEDAYGQPR